MLTDHFDIINGTRNEAHMNLIFCGTPKFAVPTLERLVEHGFSVKLAVTQPDRPRGRGLQLAASPVKEQSLQFGIPVVQPEKIKNNEEFRAQLESLRPDAIIVVGYGRIIPQWMIDLPRHGNINLHASLLPKYRGAAPIQWAIAEGEKVTGVTTMRIDAGLDTGDILLQRTMEISDEDTSETVAPRLAAIGAELMVETLNGLQNDVVRPVPQDHNAATLAPVLKREDGLINFQRTAMEIDHRLRAFQPWPGAFTGFRGKQLNISKAKPQAEPRELACGTILVERDRLLATCGGNSVLEIFELQPEGKKRMSARDFIHGYRPQTGEQFQAIAT